MTQIDILIRVSDSNITFNNGISELFTNHPSIVIIDEISNGKEEEYPIRMISLEIPKQAKDVINALIDVCNEQLTVTLKNEFTPIPNL